MYMLLLFSSPWLKSKRVTNQMKATGFFPLVHLGMLSKSLKTATCGFQSFVNNFLLLPKFRGLRDRLF